MATVLLVIHIMVAASMIVIILLQRSEGGALGMGGGTGSFVTGRGAANLLTRTTAILAAIFFITSIALGIFGHRAGPSSAVGVSEPASSGEAGTGANQEAPSSLPTLNLKKFRQETAPAQPPAAPEKAPAQPQVPQSQ